jgi:hypothetical protein
LVALCREAVAEKQRNPESLEIVRLDPGVVEIRLHVLGRGRLAVKRDRGRTKLAVVGRARCSYIHHARQRGNAGAEIADESILMIRRILGTLRKLQAEIDDMCIVIAGFHP